MKHHTGNWEGKWDVRSVAKGVNDDGDDDDIFE